MEFAGSCTGILSCGYATGLSRVTRGLPALTEDACAADAEGSDNTIKTKHYVICDIILRRHLCIFILIRVFLCDSNCLSTMQI